LFSWSHDVVVDGLWCPPFAERFFLRVSAAPSFFRPVAHPQKPPNATLSQFFLRNKCAQPGFLLPRTVLRVAPFPPAPHISCLFSHLVWRPFGSLFTRHPPLRVALIFSFVIFLSSPLPFRCPGRFFTPNHPPCFLLFGPSFYFLFTPKPPLIHFSVSLVLVGTGPPRLHGPPCFLLSLFYVPPPFPN